MLQTTPIFSRWYSTYPRYRLNEVQKNKVCRMFNATGDVPFGESGNNDFILVSYWYVNQAGTESFVAQTAYNIRADEIKHRRFNNGYKEWF